ncbi:polysaccharide pyruvyl transferase family protein [Cytobacillus gottheilii]|uniref:polysaccharide pyruvyl transferase family protein n=1 Tax=Cytobacillus gottheilii TaxID=859144 RepID=UPI0009BC5EC9|nr:polysaccharide pyruvyl transferase family protein [Cytobacillus gottheilii]
MKKIGIVPLEYHSYNYGGTLQNYALQQAFLKTGCKVEVLNFDDSKEKKLFSISQNKNKPTVKTNIKKRIQRVLNFLYYKKINSKRTKFEEFREKHFSDMHDATSLNLAKIADEFDCFVCGSDQVWNPYWCNSTHFLSFVPNNIPKVSYAASIGVDDLTDEQKVVYKPLIDDFTLVSVRETRGKEILQSFVDANVEVVLDPTMLLTSNEWNIILPNKKIKEKYIFTYFLGEDAALREYAESLAEKLGYKIVNIPFLYGEVRKADLLFGHIKYASAGPEDFISLITNAEIILTDSFHACVFSMIFHKNFYAFDRKVYGKSMSSRITGLLDSVGIVGHIIGTDYPIDNILSSSINYDEVEANLNALRENSLAFIKKTVELELDR